MTLRHSLRTTLSGMLAIVTAAATTVVMSGAAAGVPLAVSSGRVSIAGTSNVHEYTASTTTIRVTRVQLGEHGRGPRRSGTNVVKPGGGRGLRVAIPAASLTSPKGDLDKNMHKALKVGRAPGHHLPSAPARAARRAPGALRGIGVLQIAGVEREVALDLTTERKDAALAVHGEAAAPDDRLRHHAAEGDARHVEDRPEGHGHVRDGPGAFRSRSQSYS